MNFDIFNDSAQHSLVFTSPVSISKSQVGISQSLAPTLKVKIDDLFDPANAHLVQDIDLLRNVSRRNIQSIKMGQKRGLDDNKKNHMVEIDLYTHHAKRVRASRKTIDELHVTIVDGQDQPVVFGDGKTHLNMFLTPMKKSVYPLEFTILIPFNETLTLKQPVPFDGRREVGVMQIELPTNFNNVLQDEMKITVSKVVTPRYGAKTIDYTVPMGNYTEETLIYTLNNMMQGNTKVKFSIHEGKTKVEYDIGAVQETFLIINKPLAVVLGWPDAQDRVTIPGGSPGTISTQGGFQTLYMYSPRLVKECIVGDVMAAFMGTITPVLDHDVYIMDPPLVMYRQIRQDLPPFTNSIKLDLHDTLGRPITWTDPIQVPQATLHFRQIE